MNTTPTITATELKAKCLNILDRLATHELEKVFVTKRGKIVGVLSPPPQQVVPLTSSLHGCMKGTFWIDPELDLTDPIIEWNEDEHSQLPE